MDVVCKIQLKSLDRGFHVRVYRQVGESLTSCFSAGVSTQDELPEVVADAVRSLVNSAAPDSQCDVALVPPPLASQPVSPSRGIRVVGDPSVGVFQ